MKYFIDTEFSERGPKYPIELISIGIVAEDGRELYMISDEFDAENVNPWVKENVLTKLGNGIPYKLSHIASAIRVFCDPNKRGKPEFWAYYADYDWVVFCQTFGTMMDLPESYPRYCKDLMQLIDYLGVTKLPRQPEGSEHNALSDARWNRAIHEYLLTEYFLGR